MIRIADNAIHKQVAIGKKIVLIPNKVTKIVYRQGEGECPKVGDIVLAYFISYKMNGKEIQNKMDRAKKFVVGKNRLIQGLEIALMGTTKNQKFTLIIKADHAYKYLQIPEQSKILHGTLVIQFIIKDIYTPTLASYDENAKYLHLHQQYKQINQLLSMEQYQQALKIIRKCYAMMQQMQNYKNQLIVIFLQKWVNVLMFLKRYQQAQVTNKLTQKYDFYNHHYLLSNAKIFMLKGNKEQATRYLNKYHQNHALSDLHRRRKYVQFLKQNGEIETLKSLVGYDYQNDIIEAVTYDDLNKDRGHPRYMFANFFGF